MQEVETWKDVKGYEGFYEVSSIGRVKSLNRTIEHPLTGKYSIKEKLLSSRVVLNGYVSVKLCTNSISKPFMVHRLVLEAFVMNLESKPFVNHKNGIKTDNRLENLEWCTQSENIQHAHDTGLSRSWNKGFKKYDDRMCFCGKYFYPMKSKQETCSKSCARTKTIKTKGWIRPHSTILPI